jgi:cytochrome c oxidase subunit 4
MLRIGLTWLALLVLFLVELAMMKAKLGIYTPLIGPVMIACVVVGFMQLQRGSALMKIFALAGVFWLCILIGLGSLDPMTRVDHGVGPELSQAGQQQP